LVLNEAVQPRRAPPRRFGRRPSSRSSSTQRRARRPWVEGIEGWLSSPQW
jgi:hypothetical protein